jgi:hypothetical protein
MTHAPIAVRPKATRRLPLAGFAPGSVLVEGSWPEFVAGTSVTSPSTFSITSEAITVPVRHTRVPTVFAAGSIVWR